MTPAARTGLYSDTIRERWRQPRFRGELPGATAQAEDVNPLCGDRVRMMVQLRNGTIDAVRFTGDSCAICTASASLLTERLIGVSVSEALGIAEDDMVAALESDPPPARRACATLPLMAMRHGLASLGGE